MWNRRFYTISYIFRIKMDDYIFSWPYCILQMIIGDDTWCCPKQSSITGFAVITAGHPEKSDSTFSLVCACNIDMIYRKDLACIDPNCSMIGIEWVTRLLDVCSRQLFWTVFPHTNLCITERIFALPDCSKFILKHLTQYTFWNVSINRLQTARSRPMECVTMIATTIDHNK